MTTRTAPSPAAMLRLDPRDRAGLEWLRQRASLWLRIMARRRKFLPPGGYSEEEAATLRALIDLERAATRLLEVAGPTSALSAPQSRGVGSPL